MTGKRIKNWIRVVIGILCVTLLSGWGWRRDRGKTKSKVILRYVFWGDVSEYRMNQHWIKSFEAKYPNIKINPIHVPAGQGVASKILTMLAGGTPPDVMYIWPEAFPEFSRKKILLPLNKFLERDGINIDRWFPQLIEPYKSGDKIYGLPRSWHPYILYYNKNLFDEAGIPYPDETWTWEDVIEYGKKLTRDRNGDGIIDQFAIANIPYPILVWSSGGSFFKDGKPTFDAPGTIEGLQLARDLIWKYKISPTPEQLKTVQSAEDMFFTGRVAMFGLGIWAVPRFREIKTFQWDITIMPKGKVRRTLLVTAGWGISAKSKHPDEAWEFVKYLSGEEAQTYQMKIWRDPSGLVDIFQKYLFYEPDKPPRNREVILKSIKIGKFKPVFVGSQELWDKISEDMDKIFFSPKNVDVAEICRSMQKKAEEFMRERKEKEVNEK